VYACEAISQDPAIRQEYLAAIFVDFPGCPVRVNDVGVAVPRRMTVIFGSSRKTRNAADGSSNSQQTPVKKTHKNHPLFRLNFL
jgi:hypothetical protein